MPAVKLILQKTGKQALGQEETARDKQACLRGENMSRGYTKEELFEYGNFHSYEDSCLETAFLLGGIGTGTISVGSRGQLKDWEIFDTAGKVNYMPNGFFAVWCDDGHSRPWARVLESRLQPPFTRSRGFQDYEEAGIPRFAHAVSHGKYPFWEVELTDPQLPISVTMESFTPFIPLNEKDSGIPTALIRYKVKNLNSSPLNVSVAGSLSNLSSLKCYDRHTWNYYQTADEGVNEYRECGDMKGLFFRPKTLSEESIYYGTLALTTKASDLSYKRAWLNGGWWDGLQDMWDDFISDGRLEPESAYTQKDVTFLGTDLTGSLAVHQTIAPGEVKVFEFQLSWHFPNRVRCWSRRMYDEAVRGKETYDTKEHEQPDYPVVQKMYGAMFRDAWAAAEYTFRNLERLEGDSRMFSEAFYSATLPSYVLEAVAGNITVIRSNTCFWLADGTFLAWEGCFDDEGCCEGNCTHVWSYTQTMAFLFPRLEQNMRRLEYTVETEADGKMNFRSYNVWGMGSHGHVPAADGQMGCLIRLYRDWKISGDDGFLKEMWPNACKSLDFAFDYWDRDGDYVLDSQQFNTYDIAFTGPNSMVNSMFFAALKAGSQIAAYLGDEERSKRYDKAWKEGSRRMDGLLWNGEYYIQKLKDVNEYRYQYGRGCLSDQILGQTLAHVAGLGYVLPREHAARAVRSVFEHNFKESFRDVTCLQRTYVLNDEKGLVLCSWKKDCDRPRFPFPYSDEVWTGIEYQVATDLIFEGFVEEGLTLVKAVRQRQDGIRRNPWNEVECGHHYARSLASYGVLNALCGFRFDLCKKRVSFRPALREEDFTCFFCVGSCWGIYRQKREGGQLKKELIPLYGESGGLTLYEEE